jgi:hypothetical protein
MPKHPRYSSVVLAEHFFYGSLKENQSYSKQYMARGHARQSPCEVLDIPVPNIQVIFNQSPRRRMQDAKTIRYIRKPLQIHP